MQMVLTRELQANSRRAQTYHRRLIAAGSVVGIIFLFAIFGSTQRQSGAPLFYSALTIAFIVCSFEAINRSCSSITTEKEEGTLGLLLLTRLTGHELLAGKFLGAVVASLQPVLALLPALAIPIFMGGITGRDLAAASIALIHTVLIWLAAGVTASATAKTTFEAAALAVVFVTIMACFLAIFAQIGGLFLALNPMTPILLFFAPQGIEPWQIATSMLMTAAIIVVILRAVGKSLPNDWRAEIAHEATLSYSAAPPPAPIAKPVAVASRHEPGTVPRSSEFSSPRWFEGNPIAWLVLRETGMHNTAAGRIAFSVLLGVAILSFNAYVGFFFSWLLILMLACVSPVCAARARRTGAFELILTTDTSEHEIRAGYFKGIRQIFLWPATILFAATAVRVVFDLIAEPPDADIQFVLALAFYEVLMLLFASAATAVFGFYAGLKSPTPWSACLKSAFIGVILPWLLLPIPSFVYFPILWGIADMSIARLRQLIESPGRIVAA